MLPSSGDGPYCWKDFKLDNEAHSLTIQLHTDAPSKRLMHGHVVSGDGLRTNEASAEIDVK